MPRHFLSVLFSALFGLSYMMLFSVYYFNSQFISYFQLD